MTELQSKLFEMLKWLVDFLNKNNIRYYVVEGTMLGTIRHKGFIPWDDDIDIAIPRDDYEKLINLFDHQIDNYVIESPKNDSKEYLYPFAKIYDVNTTMIEHLKKDVIRGVYIDIFPLDGIGDTLDEAQKNFKKIDKKNMLLAMKTSRSRKGRVWWKNLATYIGNLIPVNSKKLTRKINSLCCSMRCDDFSFFDLFQHGVTSINCSTMRCSFSINSINTSRNINAVHD